MKKKYFPQQKPDSCSLPPFSVLCFQWDKRVLHLVLLKLLYSQNLLLPFDRDFNISVSTIPWMSSLRQIIFKLV